MILNNCASCQKPMDHNVKHLIAYVNGKPIHSPFCTVCIKKQYEDIFYKEFPSFKVNKEE